MDRFVIIDGKVVEKEEVNLTKLYWKLPLIISQKIWFGFGGIPLFPENLDSINQQLEMLKIPIPDLFRNQRELFRITKRMLNKNKFYRSGIIHIQLLWKNEKMTIVIFSEAFNEFDFPISEHGILINYSTFKKHSQNALSQFQFFNMNLWDSEQTQLKNSHSQNSVFLNEKNTICDCIGANIFFIRENVLLTPSIQTGCLNDTLRNTIVESAWGLNLKVVESEKIVPGEVPAMNEIFIAGEAVGIQWVMGVENKRFVHHYSALIHKKLNEFLKGKVH